MNNKLKTKAELIEELESLRKIDSEEDLPKQQYYLAKAQELGRIGTWELNIIKNELIWTDQNYINFGVPLGTTPLTYEIFLDTIHPDDREYVNNEWIAALDGKSYDIEHRVIVDDSIRWVREKAEIEFDAAGKAIKAIGFTQDVTERKQTEELLKESANRLRLSMDAAKAGSWTWDLETNEVIWDDRMQEIFGFVPGTYDGTYESWKKCVHPEDVDEADRQTKEAVENRTEYDFEYRLNLQTKDKVWRTVRAQAIVVSKDKGEGIRMAGFCEDITQRKQAEEELQASKDYLSNIINAIGDPVFVKDDECRFILANDSLCEILGIERENIIGKTLGESLPDNQMKHFLEIDNMVLESGQENLSEELLTGRGGKILTIITKKTRYVDGQGNRFLVGTIRDITERKQAEEEAVAYRNFLDSVPGFGFAKDINLNYVFANRTFCDLLKIPYDQIKGKTDYDIFPTDLAKKYIDDDKRVIDIGKPLLVEEVTIDANMNQRITVATRKHPWLDKKGNVIGVYGMGFDISEIKEVESALRVSEERFTLAMNASNDGLFDWNLETNDIYYSPGWKKMLGYENHELANDFSVWEKTTAEEDVKKSWELQQKLIAKQIDRFVMEFKMKHKDGHWVDILSRAEAVFNDEGKAIRIVGTHTDVTERKQAEEERIAMEAQLRQSQKLEAIGTMVGGISHEFNNVLQSMFLYSGLVQSGLPEDEELRSNFQHILDDGNRAKDLIKQILTFSRETKVEMKPQPLHEMVMEVLVLERASLPVNIDIQQDIDLNCGPVLCDKTQSHQIIVNLCNNAQHAMADHGGTLTVSLKPTWASLNKNAPEMDVLQLTVSDTGYGIEASVLEKIFDPFFTTKELGQGTGLGLSVIHGIVEMMEGHISVTSEIGKGTTFLILFPTTTIAVERNMVNSPVEVARGGRCVLLADDEESIRSVTQIILTRKGFKVDSASDGTQALELFKANPGKYDLIVTDQSMPKMSGVELTKAIRDSRSDIPIILSTGQLGIEDEKDFKNIGITAFIQKPWTAEELIERIQELDTL